MSIRKFRNIKALAGLFVVFSLLSLVRVKAVERNGNLFKSEISLNKKKSGVIYLLNLDIPEYSKCGYSKEIISRLKKIDVKMANFVKTNFKKYDFENKNIKFNGERKDIFKYYELMYEIFVASFKELKNYFEYDPKNIDYIGVSEDCLTAYFNLNCSDLSEDESVENCDDASRLKRYACEALIREIILSYIKHKK